MADSVNTMKKKMRDLVGKMSLYTKGQHSTPAYIKLQRELDILSGKVAKASKAGQAEVLDPEVQKVRTERKPVPDTTAGTRQANMQASPAADLTFASNKAKKAAQARDKRKREDEAVAKAARVAKTAAEISVPTVKPQSPKQKKAGQSLSGEPTSKRQPVQSQSRDTLGMAAKSARDAEIKRAPGRRKKTAYTVDPPISKIDTMVVVKRDENGNIDIDPEKSTVTSKQAKTVQAQINEAESDGPFSPKAGKAAIRRFFDTLGIKNIEVDYTFPGDKGYGEPDSNSNSSEKQYRKSGGKVTAKQTPTKRAAVKRPTTKKYAMNRGGKVASVRKPTRA